MPFESFEKPPDMQSEEMEAALRERQKGIKINPAEAEPLTAYNEEFFIDHIENGEDVLVGRGGEGKFYLRCDWPSFEDQLQRVTPERLEELFSQVGGLKDKAPSLDEDKRKTLNACWRVTQKIEQIFDKPAGEEKRNSSFAKFSNQEKFPDCIKPLSECKGEAACSEYALLAHHILDRLGIKSSVIIGAFAKNSEELADRHTFLTLEGGDLVFDPTHTVQQENCWPPKVFRAGKPLTVESLKDMSTGKGKLGHKMKCIDLLTDEERFYGSGA